MAPDVKNEEPPSPTIANARGCLAYYLDGRGSSSIVTTPSQEASKAERRERWYTQRLAPLAWSDVVPPCVLADPMLAEPGH